MNRWFLIGLVLIIGTGASIQKNRYYLEIPEHFAVEEYAPELDVWRLSLISGVGYSEDEITQAVFLKTDIPIEKAGHTVIGTVYQHRTNPNQFFESESTTIIDFELQKVGTMGVAGISVHPTPSKRMVVVLAPSKGLTLLGVTLDFTVKTQVSPPRFGDREVDFEW